MKFCGQCAARLPRRRPGEDSESQAERRQLTVLFCDLVGSTALSEALDPEDLREVLRRYQAVSAVQIERYGGSIAQYLGDGLLVYFGYPLAQEDAARRAVGAGLAILAALERLNRDLESGWDLELKARIGIHTGLVVVGEVGGGDRREHLALGATPNLAARLQGVADPGTIAISRHTLGLLHGRFRTTSLGPHQLKGIGGEVEIFRVDAEATAPEDVDLGSHPRVSPLVGRDRELAALLDRWGSVVEGRGKAVLISGEAGVGKSRLLAALRETASRDRGLWLEAWCTSYYSNSALHPLSGLLARRLALSAEDSPADRLRKLETVAKAVGLGETKDLALLASFLSIPHQGLYDAPALTPRKRRQRTLEILLAWLLELAGGQPLVFVVEDLHWIDPSTLEWLGSLFQVLAERGILVLLTARPEFTPPWKRDGMVTALDLPRLEARHLVEIVRGLAGDRELAPRIFEDLVERSGGIPLFAEELAKAVLESRETDGPRRGPVALPSSLQDSLAARLDRLGSAKRVVQWAATLGRGFGLDLLRTAGGFEAESLRGELDRLVAAEILHPAAGGSRYVFKHALIQDAAYQGLLRRQRRLQHRRVAETLIESFAETVSSQPELVAHHFTEAQMPREAILYWHRAGKAAVERSAGPEAEAHLERGLDLVARVPEKEAAAELELELLMTRGASLLAVKGYAAPEVQVIYSRARELCREMARHHDRAGGLFPALRGLVPFFLVCARYGEAEELGEELLAAAREAANPDLLLEAHLALGTTRYWMGEIRRSLEHVEAGLELYDYERHRSHILSYGQDPGVLCLLYAGWCRWWLGEADRARRLGERAITLARRRGHPHTLAMALDHVSVLRQYLRDVEGAEALVTEGSALAEEHGFAMWAAMAGFRHSWVLSHRDEPKEGVEGMGRAIRAFRSTGALIAEPLHLALLAEAWARAGHPDRGLAALEEALGAMETRGERFYEAELHRLRGELLLATAGEDPAAAELAAEKSFRGALRVAETQGAGALRLRAATSLSAFLHEGDRHEEARGVLMPAMEGVAEGLDTRDYLAADRLMGRLSGIGAV